MRRKMGLASHRNKPAVMITITKQPNTSTLELTDKLDEALAELQKNLPADVKMSTDIYRQERFINNSIDNVKKSLYEGGIFVVIVLFLFLMNVRTTLISLVTIPLALVVSILTLNILGLTINTMSLGGMAIAIGSLVDDAIVDVENVFKRLRENHNLPHEKRRPLLTVIFEASRRGAYADSELDADYHSQFRPPFLPDRYGGTSARPAGNRFHYCVVRFHGCRPDIDTSIVQLSVGQAQERRL